MVFFTCNGCGTAVKKNQVEKHSRQCHDCQVLSCMDCGKDFWGETYQSHTKCITEDEKYGGSNYKAKPSSNKGEAKQEQWIQHIRHTIRTTEVPKQLQHILERLITYPNIPRKKAKFTNFVKNCMRIPNPQLVEQTWDIFDKAQKKQDAPAPAKNGTVDHLQPTNGANESDVSKLSVPGIKSKPPQHEDAVESNSQKGKKRKKSKETQDENELPTSDANRDPGEHDDGGCAKGTPSKKKKRRKDLKGAAEETAETENNASMEQASASNAEKPSKFKWRKTIKAYLQQEADQELKIKKLRKKVFKEYHAWAEGVVAECREEELVELFEKKLQDPSFQINGNKVKLLN